VNRRSFPAGQAAAALLKALLRMLLAEKGAPVADGWLRGVRLVRSDLEDETRMLPLPTLHRALVGFAEVASRRAIPRASTQLVAPDILGVWVRVLRGTTDPAEAFARLDTTDSQYGRTTRWETLATRRGWWRGRVSIGHDPALEEDGLLRLGRLAQLAAVPALFGYPDARASSHSGEVSRSLPVVQEFEVQWSVPDTLASGTVGAVAGSVAAVK
jgi:hypothetical protein